MKEEYSKKVASLVETGQRLMLATAEDLLCDNDLDIQSWQQILNTYEESVLKAQSINIPILAERIGQLACVLTASTLDATIQFTTQILTTPEKDLPLLLSQTVVAKRRTELDRLQPTNQFELAERLHELIPYVGDLEKVALGIRGIIQNLHQVLEPLIQQGNFTAVIEPTVLYVILANRLAYQFSLPMYMGKALDWGEQIIRNTPPTASLGHAWALAADLIPTCRWLARNQDLDKQMYLEKGISLALYCRDALRFDNESLDREMYLKLFESNTKSLAALHLDLAAITPSQFYTHAIEIWKTLQRYTTLAQQYPGQDLGAETPLLREYFWTSLWLSQPEWVVSSYMRQNMKDLVRELFLGEDTNSYQVQELMIADQITFVTDLVEQRKSIETILNWWYSELNDLLLIIVSEVGLNYYVCRFLFVLGLIASGRVGSLIPPLIPNWKWRMGEGDIPPGYNRKTLYLQQLSPEKSLTQAKSLVKIITALSEFTEALQQNPTLVDTARLMLREHNAALLRNLLSHGVHAQKSVNRVQTRIEDLMLLLKKIPKQARLATLDSYTKTDLSIRKEPTPIEPISPDGLLDVPTVSLSPVPFDSPCLLPCGHEQRPKARFCSVCGASIPS